jgi:hypothetical protein
MRIGIDFDNTIACYDEAFVTAARERGLLPASFSGTKISVRGEVRALPDGERQWQALQGWVYGAGMSRAVLIPGVADVLRRFRQRGDELFIISHKSEYGHFDPLRINLREAALTWMEAQGFFAADGLALPRDNVFFEATRDAKVARIAAVSPDLFIDDLPEVLEHPDFPAKVRRILFDPTAEEGRRGTVAAGVCRRSDWLSIGREVLALGD